jgi:ligand-binding sensor domain-containing protein
MRTCHVDRLYTNTRKCIILLACIVLFASEKTYPQNGSWKTYTNTDYAPSIVDGKTSFWTSSLGGIVQFDKNTGSPIVQVPRLHGQMILDFQGSLWVANANDTKLSKYDGHGWSHFEVRNKNGTPLYVRSMSVDSKNRLWVSGTDSGSAPNIGVFDGSSWKWFDKSDGLPLGSIENILCDHEGNTWAVESEFSTGRYYYSVVVRIDFTGGVKVWKQEDGLPPNKNSGGMRAIVLDSSGSIWVGRTEGVSRFDGTKWKLFPRGFTVNGMMAGAVNLAVDGAGNIWMSGYVGIDKYDGVKWSHYDQTSGLVYPVGLPVVSTSGKLWVITGNGISQFLSNSWKNYSVVNGLPDSNCWRAVPDATGEILVSTSNGVARFDKGKWIAYRVNNTPHLNQVRQLCTDLKERLWVTYSSEPDGNTALGVGSFDGTTWIHYTTSDGLPNDTANGLARDSKGNVWFAFQRSIAYYDGSHWRNFSVPIDTLTKWRVYKAIACDSFGNVWVSCSSIFPDPNSSNGSSISIPEVYKFNGETWARHVGSADFAIPVFGLSSIAVDSHGALWGCGFQLRDDATTLFYGGLYRYDGQKWNTITLEDSIGDHHGIDGRSIVCDPNGSVWILCGDLSDNAGRYLGSLVRFNGVSWTNYGTSEKGFYYMTIDRTGKLLTSGGGGILRFDGSNWTVAYQASDTGLVFGVLTSVSNSPDGSIWFGTDYGISVLFDPTSSVPTRAEPKSGLSLSVFPNPISASATMTVGRISFSCPGHVYARLTIYNVLGQQMSELYDGETPRSEEQELAFDTRKLPVGAYYAHLQADGHSVTAPILVVR